MVVTKVADELVVPSLDAVRVGVVVRPVLLVVGRHQAEDVVVGALEEVPFVKLP